MSQRTLLKSLRKSSLFVKNLFGQNQKTIHNAMLWQQAV